MDSLSGLADTAMMAGVLRIATKREPHSMGCLLAIRDFQSSRGILLRVLVGGEGNIREERG